MRPDQPRYRPTQVAAIAENILRFQRANGGWPKDYDMLAVLTAEQAQALEDSRNLDDTSFDNHNIHSQVDYLARAAAAADASSAANVAAWRRSCLRGLDFMLAAQLPNGGFPQRYPHAKGFAGHITFNDGVTIGVLEVLQDIAEDAPHWKWLDSDRRHKATQAVERGVDCILQCQIRSQGQLTGWCQQHDPTTFAAASARTFELASICPQETVSIARFLMRSRPHDPAAVKAVDAAVAWLDSTRLSGIRVERVSAPATQFERHDADFDTIVVADAAAPPLWARHYEIGSNRPIFAGRDGVKKYALADIERERRTGTPWYGAWPEKLLAKEYPRWHDSLGQNSADPRR